MDFRSECERRLVTATYVMKRLGLPHRIYVGRLVRRGKLPDPVFRSEYPRLHLYDKQEVDAVSNDGNKGGEK